MLETQEDLKLSCVLQEVIQRLLWQIYTFLNHMFWQKHKTFFLHFTEWNKEMSLKTVIKYKYEKL